MPHIIDQLGEDEPLPAELLAAGHIVSDVDTSISPELAWVLDPFAPVPSGQGEPITLQESTDSTTEKEPQVKDYDKTLELIESLAEDEVNTLADLVGGLNRLEMEDGSPKYIPAEIDLIGRFADIPEADEDDEDEPEGDDDIEVQPSSASNLGDVERAEDGQAERMAYEKAFQDSPHGQ